VRWVVHLLREAALHGLAVLLPDPERGRLARRHSLDAPLASLVLGLAQGVVGAGGYMAAGIAFLRGVASDSSRQLLENWSPELTSTHVNATGLAGWLVWLVHPLSWPWAYLALVGAMRAVAFAATREAVGEPLVVAGLRTAQHVAAAMRRRRELRRLGPPRPDAVTADGDGLVVVTCRPKPDWNETATVEIDGRHYRVAARSTGRDGGHEAIVYRLAPAHPGAIVRRLVRYDPPPVGNGGHNRSGAGFVSERRCPAPDRSGPVGGAGPGG